MEFDVIDSNNVEEFLEDCNNDIIREKMNSSDILVIPAKYSDGEYYFAQESVDFVKYCRLKDDEHQIDILADGDIKKRTLHSFDIWMGVIYVAEYILLPIATGLVSWQVQN